MALGPRLDLRQSQSLVMTPQLQQAIKLLALSNLEIEARSQRHVGYSVKPSPKYSRRTFWSATSASGEPANSTWPP